MSTNFSPEEQAVIEELERRTVDCCASNMLEDNYHFYRFAKARNFNLDEAETMIRKQVSWRKDFDIDTILTDYKPPEALEKYLPSCMLCFDKEGRAVRYTDCGQVDHKGLLNCFKNEDLMKYYAYLIEQDFEAVLKRNKKLGEHIFMPIFDFENLPIAVVTNMKVLQHGLYTMKAYVDNYPQRLKCAFVINAPFYFVWAFAIFKQILPATVVNKVQIYGTDGWKEKLLEVIDADVLPAFLGGNKTDPDGNPHCKTFVKRGEPIPKSYYMRNEKRKMEGSFEKLMVQPFSKQAISFEVKKANSNLEWEYELKYGDIDFSLHFKEETLEPVELLPKRRTSTDDDTEKGLFKCEKEGIYTMVFDNSYSWIYPKEVLYKAGIKPPNCDRSGELL